MTETPEIFFKKKVVSSAKCDIFRCFIFKFLMTEFLYNYVVILLDARISALCDMLNKSDFHPLFIITQYIISHKVIDPILEKIIKIKFNF